MTALALAFVAHQIVTEGAADQISALLGERKFSCNTANSVGSEQLPLLAHRKTLNIREKMRTRDDK